MAYYIVRSEAILAVIHKFFDDRNARAQEIEDFIKTIPNANKKGWYPKSRHESGLRAIRFKGKPPKGWVSEPRCAGGYRPHKSLNIVKEIREKWEELGSVPFSPVNDAIGFTSRLMFNEDQCTWVDHPGLEKLGDTYVIELDGYRSARYKPPEGMEEITTKEYDIQKAKDILKRENLD